jgi:hypothetical protein
MEPAAAPRALSSVRRRVKTKVLRRLLDRARERRRFTGGIDENGCFIFAIFVFDGSSYAISV